MEDWKDIEGFEGLYQVSNHGRVRSVDRIVVQKGRGKEFAGKRKGRILSQREQNSGYMLVWICKKGKDFAFTVHRLVAKAFVKNPCNYDDVNHKDGNKKNNFANNLEWCTKSQNEKHAYKIGLAKPNGCIAIRCIDTGEIFKSIREAARKMNTSHVVISHVLHGRNKTAGGYLWEKVERKG